MATPYLEVTAFGATRRIRLYDDRAEISLPVTRMQSDYLDVACREAAQRMRAENGGAVGCGVAYLREKKCGITTNGVTEEILTLAY